MASRWVVGEDETGTIKGRMKFCRPIFRSVFKVDGTLALEVFAKFKEQFHPIAKKMIEKVGYHKLKVTTQRHIRRSSSGSWNHRLTG